MPKVNGKPNPFGKSAAAKAKPLPSKAAAKATEMRGKLPTTKRKMPRI